MVRAVKTKSVRSLGKGQRAVLLPGATGAEPWELWVMGGKDSPQMVQTCATPAANRLRRNSTLAFPAAQVYCLPLWLQGTDAKSFAGMIALQIELRGLKPRGNEAVFDWTVVAQEGARTLVMVGVLPASLAAEMQAESYDVFDLSARYLPFPESAVTIWREQDRLAVAITRGKNLVYFQALAEGQVSPRTVQDLNCARATLAMQGITTALQRIYVWTELTPAEVGTLAAALQLPVEQSERPAPKAPSPAWKLTPSTVGAAKRAREAQRWQRMAFIVAGLLYLLLVGWLVTRYYLLSNQVAELTKWQNDNAPAVTLVHQGRAAWKELRPVVDEDSYPLELLLEACSSIPADQLHLTLFEASDGHLLIKGEAKNVAAAFQFKEKLQGDPHLSGYTWLMGNPHPLPNDLAQFQIEGTRTETN